MMGRKAHAKYIEAALAVLQEFGGGPISTKTLVIAAQERGLIGDGKWVYHNFSRKVRGSDLFDSSVRGQISLAQNIEPVVEDASRLPADEEVMATEPQPETFPSPTLGSELPE